MTRPAVLGLAAILLVSLLAKLWILAIAAPYPERLRERDSVSYERPAQSLLRTGTLSTEVDGVVRPDNLRTPGYPVFLALIFGAVGERPVAVAFAQAVISLLTLVVVWWLAGQLWGAEAALLSAATLALEPLSVGFALQLLTETLFTFLFVAFLVGIFLFHRMPGSRAALFCGLFLGLATLVRPVSYYLTLPVALGLFLWARARGARRRTSLSVGAAFLLPVLVLVGGWQLRNYVLVGSGQFSRIEGKSLLYFKAAAVVAQRDGVMLEEARRRLGDGAYQELHPETREWTLEQLDRRWRQEGLAIILRHPTSSARVWARGVFWLFAGPGDSVVVKLLGLETPREGPLGDLKRLSLSEYWRRWVVGETGSFLLFAIALVHMLAVYAGNLGFAALLRFRGQDWMLHLFFLLVGLALVLLSAGPEAYYRFRVPLSPLLSLYGAAGLLAMRDAWRRRARAEIGFEA